MALHLKLKPRAITLSPFRSTVVTFSSSSDVPPMPESNSEGGENDAAGGPQPPSYSYFSDIKERLKSHPAPPRRIPLEPPRPPSLSSPATGAAPAASFDEIRKHLAEFRQMTPTSGDRARPRPESQQSTISFQDLFKNNVLNKPSGISPTASSDNDGRLSFEAIREKLRQIPKSNREQTGPRNTPFNLRSIQDSYLHSDGTEKTTTSILGSDALPDLIFGREKREKEEGKGESGKELKTEFLKTYSYDELGEKLRKLRSETAAKGDEGFLLTELNERLVKLRELEEKEKQSGMSSVFKDLRESLVKLKDAEANKKSNLQRTSIITSLTGQVTPTFMLNPPQEQLLEKYLHPDHMSSAEKMKLELKKVRDEFKMSESDCGSARVQVAQLTTKIKHLSSVLHKKDKHSRKGLVDMVQKRKKLLKYLRRTDWDSYCLVLSKLGLRDVPEYRARDYKS